jgi:hypothetical protein
MFLSGQLRAPAAFPLKKESLVPVGYEAGLNDWENRNSLTSDGLEPGLLGNPGHSQSLYRHPGRRRAVAKTSSTFRRALRYNIAEEKLSVFNTPSSMDIRALLISRKQNITTLHLMA